MIEEVLEMSLDEFDLSKNGEWCKDGKEDSKMNLEASMPKK